MNGSNMNYFSGRIASDVKADMKGQGQNQYLRLSFRLAVNRALSKQQKQDNANAKAQNPNLPNDQLPHKDADFIPMSMTGALATSMQPHLVKGKPMGFWCEYQEWRSTDQAGQVKYNHGFKVISPMFHMKDSTQNNAGGGYQQAQGGGYQQPAGNYQQPAGGYQQPAAGGYQQPAAQPAYQQPQAPAQPAQPGYQQPTGGYQQPQGNYQQPAAQTAAAPAPAQAPANGAAPNYQVDDSNVPF